MTTTEVATEIGEEEARGVEIVYASWELPEVIWEMIDSVLIAHNWRVGRPTEVDLSIIAAGIFYVLRTGIPWNAAPREKFGPPSTVYYYFQQWRDDGIFLKIWQKALERYDELKGLDWVWLALDGAMTKAPQGGEKTGPNPTDRGKSGTKRSMATDANGIPIALIVAGANIPDMKLLEETLDNIVAVRPEPSEAEPQNLSLDKGYDYEVCKTAVTSRGYIPHMRRRGEEMEQRREYPDYKPRRWVVEVTHSWINRFRKVLIRFEELESSYLALLHFACAYIVLKRAESF